MLLTFSSYKEDIGLRKPKREAKYDKRRTNIKLRSIFWDVIGIKAYQFQAADLQCDMFIDCYDGNYFKSGTYTQCCRYLVT